MSNRIPEDKKHIRKNSIITFVQMPPMPAPFEKVGKKDKAALGADDLFSRFTADIIKENVVFTR